MVNGSPASRSGQPRGSKTPRTELQTRDSMSFDPHPIDLLAQSCLLIEEVALQRLSNPIPQAPALQESRTDHGLTNPHPLLAPANSVTLFNLRRAEQGTHPPLLQHPPQVQDRQGQGSFGNTLRFSIFVFLNVKNHQIWKRKEFGHVKHLHSLYSRVSYRVDTAAKTRKTATRTASHFGQGRDHPRPLHSAGRWPPRQGTDSAHAWPAGWNRPRRAAYTWRRLPQRQTPPDAPAPAAPRRAGQPKSRAAEASDLWPNLSPSTLYRGRFPEGSQPRFRTGW
jgi:hypothetical protein